MNNTNTIDLISDSDIESDNIDTEDEQQQQISFDSLHNPNPKIAKRYDYNGWLVHNNKYMSDIQYKQKFDLEQQNIKTLFNESISKLSP
eukprot:UN01283